MNGLELLHGSVTKRLRPEGAAPFYKPCPAPLPPPSPTAMKLLSLSVDDSGALASVVPPVTVVLDGRAICHRVCLDKYTSYESLAKALRRIFVDGDEGDADGEVEIANAVPGYVVAYEDMEDDLLLVGDLNWK